MKLKIIGMTQLRTFFLLTIILTTTISVFGQVNCDTIKHPKLMGNKYQCRWNIFQLPDTISGIVVDHDQQMIGCGVWATASVTILKVDNDTIRILDLCNNEAYAIGQRITVVPSAEPEFQVLIANKIYVEGKKIKGKKRVKLNKQQKQEQRKNIELANLHLKYLDEFILKTTWGQIYPE